VATYPDDLVCLFPFNIYQFRYFFTVTWCPEKPYSVKRSRNIKCNVNYTQTGNVEAMKDTAEAAAG